jgi:hypothetical protein
MAIPIALSFTYVTDAVQETFSDHVLAENEVPSSSGTEMQTGSGGWVLLLVLLMVAFLLFLFITNILGVVSAYKCGDTVWTILGAVGVMTGIPLGTIYYFFLGCANAAAAV